MRSKPAGAPADAGAMTRDGKGRTTAPPSEQRRTRPTPPSRAQRKVLDFVRAYMREHGVAPSRSEITVGLGKHHKSTADYHLTMLMKKGWLAIRPHQPRYIRLLHEELPVVRAGPIAPDQDTLADARAVDWVAPAVAEQFEPAAELFVVVGDESMRGAGLSAGDRVAVHATDGVPAAGQIVIVRTLGTHGELMVRRLQGIDKDRIAVQAEPAGGAQRDPVVELEASETRIEGIMVGAIIGPRTRENVSGQTPQGESDAAAPEKGAQRRDGT